MHDFALQFIIHGGDGEKTEMCRNLLSGEALATWRISEVSPGESVMMRAREDLSRPGVRLRVVGSDGSLMSESCTWADVVQGSGPVGRPAKHRRVT